MRRHVLTSCMVAALAAMVGACETAKSSNPTSPSVAGPIAGVTISDPKPLEPGNNWTISSSDQPITLLLENSSYNGQRSLAYLFEIAADVGFTTKVFTRDGIAPGTAGRTSLKLPDALAADRTYYWRARASDGANSSNYSAAVAFTIVTPAVIGAPAPLSPTGGTRVSTRRPEFVIRNSSRSGPVGNITYVLEIATNETFTAVLAVITAGENAVETRVTPALELPFDTRIFWRARASDGESVSPWSVVQNFLSPAQPSLSAPQPVSPIGGVRVSTSQPEFVVRNSARSNVSGSVSYTLDIARDDAFANMIAIVTVGEQSGETKVTPALTLPGNTQVFWRARAQSGDVTSPYSAVQTFLTPTVSTPPPPPPGAWPRTGPEVVAYVERRYPDRLLPVGSLGQRQANMAFIRDRMIEAGICGGMDLGWNLKRGGPELSIDFLVHRSNGQDIGVDIGMDYDNYSTPLRLYWGAGAPGPFYARYTPRPTCQ